MSDRDLIVVDVETIPDQSENAVSDIEKNLTVKAPDLTKPKLIDALDLGSDGKFKTVPELKEMWLEKFGAQAKKEQAESEWLKTSFDGSYGQIICICASINGVIEKYTDEHDNEAGLLDRFWSDVSKQTRSPMFVAHNAKFDLPFIYKRSVINGVEIPVIFKPYGRHGSQYFCTMEAWEGFNGRIKLDTLAKILKVGKKTEGIDGSKVFGEWQDGNIKKIADYCRDDVQLTLDIYNKLTIK